MWNIQGLPNIEEPQLVVKSAEPNANCCALFTSTSAGKKAGIVSELQSCGGTTHDFNIFFVHNRKCIFKRLKNGNVYGLGESSFSTTPLYDRGVCYYVPSHGTRSHNLISMMKHNDQLKWNLQERKCALFGHKYTGWWAVGRQHVISTLPSSRRVQTQVQVMPGVLIFSQPSLQSGKESYFEHTPAQK